MPPLPPRRQPSKPTKPTTPFGRMFRGPLMYVILLLVLVVIFLNTLNSSRSIKDLSLTQYLDDIQSGQVASADIYNRDQRVEGTLTDGSNYRVTYPDDYADDLTNALADAKVAKVKVHSQQGNALLGALIQFLPFLLILGIFFWLFNNAQAGGNRVMNFGKTRAKQVSKEAPKVTFKDVAGVDEAVEELEEIKDFLENPAKFQSVGAKIPKGVLLFGPPGSGKTLLARAVAGEAGVPFFSISGSDFVEMFVGVGAAATTSASRP